MREERLKKKKRMKIMIAVLLVILAVLVVVAVWMLRSGSEKENKPADASAGANESGSVSTAKLTEQDFQFTVPADQKELGTVQEKKEIADYEGYILHYPAIGNETIDAAVAQRADDIISLFKNQVQSLRTDGRTRMLMTVDYEIYQTDEALVSVKFNIHRELPQENLSGDSVETYTYRLSDGAEISLSDVMKEGYLELLAQKTEEFAGNQSGTLKTGAAAAADVNFQYYTWNEDGLTLYFPGKTLIEETVELLSFTIPMDEVRDYLTLDLGGEQAAQGTVTSGVDPAKPMVCLTFDDGPKASTTPELLDILEANDARATFFVVGSSLKSDSAEQIVKRAVSLGCQIGNHTLEHKNFKDISDDEITRQIDGVNEILEGWGLSACGTVRPPYGGWNNHVIAYVTDYPFARWNVDTEDWKTRDAEATINTVLYDEDLKAADGDIILMHDIHPETIEACRTIIPELKARGFQLVTMEEMFAAKGIPYEGGHVYYSSGDIRTDFGS